MSAQANTRLVGAFVIGALILAIGAVLVLGRGILFRHAVPVVMFFDGDVNGLPVGAPIAFRGVKVGQITRIRIQVGSGGKIAVYGRFDERQLPAGDPEHQLQALVQEGLRAQLGAESLISGQLYVSLNLLPTTTPTRYGFDPSAFEIPTVPSELQLVTERGMRLLTKFESLDLEKLVNAAAAAADGIDRRVRSPQVTEALRSVTGFFNDAARLARQAEPVLASFKATADSVHATSDTSGQAVAETAQALQRLAVSLEKTSDAAQTLLANVDTKVDPLVASVMGSAEQVTAAAEKARGALGRIDHALGGESPLGQQLQMAIREVTEASRSVRVLADYLEHHPGAVVWGKGEGS